MTLIDGDKIVTAQLYDDQYEEFTEKKMSIIDYVNTYTDEGVTTADDILGRIRAEIEEHSDRLKDSLYGDGMRHCIDIIDKHMMESEEDENDKDN